MAADGRGGRFYSAREDRVAVKHFSERLIDLAVAVLLAAMLLSFAWSIARPLVPVLVGGAGLLGFVMLGVRRVRGF